MTPTLARALLVVAPLALALLPRPARAQDDPAALVAVVMDDRQTVEKRMEALSKAVALANAQPQPRSGPLKEALGPLIDRLVPKRTDAAQTRFIQLALRATDSFRPFPELATRVRPLLAATTLPALRQATLRLVRIHELPGLGAELEAYVRETPDAPEREALQNTLIEAAKVIGPADGVRVLVGALETSGHPYVRMAAAEALGGMRSEPGRRALTAACRLQEPDELVACTAALALGRYGVLDGVAALAARLERQGARGSVGVYQALCRSALRDQEGFGGVAPADFYAVGREARAAAVAAALAWWKVAQTRTADDALFDALKAHDVAVPNDRRGRDAVSALIEGLTVEPRTLRYAALDRLVDLTGRADLAEDFRIISTQLRGAMYLRETEPVDGFNHEARKAALIEHQIRRQGDWRQWWNGAKARAELIGGKWVVKG